MTVRVVIADDHSVVRQGLQTFLELDDEIKVVGVASNGKEALELTQAQQPDVVLMDVLMPNMGGLEATTQIRHNWPDTEVLILSSVLDQETISKIVQVGAIGYVLKNMEAEAIIRAIKAAAAGQVTLSPEVARVLADKVSTPAPPEPLTDRELDVLRQVALGKTNKEIAYKLGLSDKTIKVHVSIILAKLSVQSRTQAALYATRLGLVGDS